VLSTSKPRILSKVKICWPWLGLTYIIYSEKKTWTVRNMRTRINRKDASATASSSCDLWSFASELGLLWDHIHCLSGLVTICWIVVEISLRKGNLWPNSPHATFIFDLLTSKVDPFMSLSRGRRLMSIGIKTCSLRFYNKFGNRDRRTNGHVDNILMSIGLCLSVSPGEGIIREMDTILQQARSQPDNQGANFP